MCGNDNVVRVCSHIWCTHFTLNFYAIFCYASILNCYFISRVETDEPNEGLGTVPEIGHLFSYSSYAVDLWSISHIHQIFTSIG